jgi:hypothetical protein
MTTRLDVIEARLLALEQGHSASELELRVAALEAGHVPRTFFDDAGRLYLQFGADPPVRIPGLVDRGTWSPTTAYRKGDGTTWDGSYWVAVDDAPTREPGDGPASGWRMCVRRGREGKAGKPAIATAEDPRS